MFYFILDMLFSSPELKAQVSFSDHLSFVVCLSVRPSVCKIFLFGLLLKNQWPILTNLGTKHPWVKGIQVYTNEGLFPFPRGDNCKIVKLHWQHFKIFFSRTDGPISTKLGTYHPWVKGIQVCSNEEPIKSPKINNVFFLLLINVMI